MNSITNPTSVSSLTTDQIKPYTFIEFVAKSNSINDNIAFLQYKKYIAEWAMVQNSNTDIISSEKLLQDQVIELLKVITVSYTTPDEQAFIANLNWDFESITDPLEKENAKNSIYSALPIFVNRIKEICNFYKERRTDATFSIERNKIRGTYNSIEKLIYDKILSYLFNNNPNQLILLKNYINISIDNYVDVYANYFDIDQSTAKTFNYNNIDNSIYFEISSVLSDMLFDGYVYLREIPLIAQLSIDLTQDCVGDKLILKNELIAKSELSLIPDTEKIELRKKLYEKYIGVDFYYLFKNQQGEISTDIFIKAQNPSGNLLNQQTIDTPFSPSKQLKLLTNIGLFFKPDKNSLLKINTLDYSYTVDYDKIETDKIYIFPDPKIYGNVAFNKQDEYPYIITYSFKSYSKSIFNGWSFNDPAVNHSQQAIYPYYSKEQDFNEINKNKLVKESFEDLYNEGFISKYKNDLYGNKFALYKEQVGKFNRNWNIDFFNPVDSGEIPEDVQQLIILDGGAFDSTTATQISADKIEWTENNNYYNYFIEAGVSTLVPQYFRAYIPDGATVGNGDFKLSVTDVSDPLQYTMFDSYTFDINYSDYPLYNSGITDLLPGINPEYESSLVPDITPVTNLTCFDIKTKRGKLFIDTVTSNKSKTYKDVFPWMVTSAFSADYKFFFDNLIDFDIIENVLILYASDSIINGKHILIEAITYNNSLDIFEQKNIGSKPIMFTNLSNVPDSLRYDAFDTKTFDSFSSYFVGNTNTYNKVSNLFYVEKIHKCYFVSSLIHLGTKTVNNTAVGISYITPVIYEIDVLNGSLKKYTFDLQANLEQIQESFYIPIDNSGTYGATINNITSLNLSHSYINDTFNLSYIINDISNTQYVVNHTFKLIYDKNLDGYINNDSLSSTVYSANYV